MDVSMYEMIPFIKALSGLLIALGDFVKAMRKPRFRRAASR